MGLRDSLNRWLVPSAPRRARTGVYVPLGVRGEELAGGAGERRATLGPVGVLFCLGLAAATAAVLNFGVLPPPLKLHERAAADFSARVDFYFESPRWLEQRQKQRAEEALPVYQPVPGWEKDQLRDLKRCCEIVEQSRSADEAEAEARIAFRSQNDVRLVVALYDYYDRHRPLTLTANFLPSVEGALRALGRGGVVDNAAYEAVWNKKGEKAILRPEPSGELTPIPLGQLRDLDKALYDFQFSFLQPKHYPEDLQAGLVAYLRDRRKPSLVLDPDQTQLEQRRQEESVASDLQWFPRGAVLVPKDSLVDADTLRLLTEEARAFKEGQPAGQRVRGFLALFVVAGMAILFCVLGFRRLQTGLFRRRRPLLMLALTGLAVLAIARLLLINGLPGQWTPVAFVAMTAALAFSSAAALIVTVALSVLAGFASEGNLPLAVALMVGAAVCATPAHKIQHRWDLLRYGILGGLAQGLTVAGLSQLGRLGLGSAEGLLLSGSPWQAYPALPDTLWGVLNCVACGLLLLGALPLVESTYGIVTNIRLLELSDQNQPALRRIMLEAPGTWAHSLQVATLCEPAAEAIGANARLVRAGVYYHDLGKTLKPEYYVENQLGAEELHRRLSPSVSSLIITSHVKDGIELAREYGLPAQIIAFIPEHHGTSLVQYFYHSARQKAQADRQDVNTVEESFFRYPGPKPRSRETAIVMLADTVEAASRTLESPSATRLRGFIHDMVMQKLLSGQLDECDLTFRDLGVVEEVFVRVLVSRFHSRVRYPGQAPEPVAQAAPAPAAAAPPPPAAAPARATPAASGERPRPGMPPAA